jgi:ribosomal protein S18 acetylase RimI-like enzyme
MAVEAFPIRAAVPADLPALGRLGGHLMRMHYAFDPQRFMSPGEDPEKGYAWFLGTQLNEDNVVILVAEADGAILGYVYAGIEPQSWRELRERAGYIHDLVVEERWRRRGVATALMIQALAWLRTRDVPRVVLWTAQPNLAAQRLFDRLGFRRTMLEMTREL